MWHHADLISAGCRLCAVWIGLLGAVEARPDGVGREPAPLGGLRVRGLVARLALDAGRAVPVPALVDDLWGDTPPGSTANALQALVSRLRRAVGSNLVATVAGGYRLAVPADAVDAARFGELVAAASGAGDPRAGYALLGQALGLWRGPALADVRELPFAEPAAHRLAERRAAAVEERARLALLLGEPSAEIDALTAQLDAAPLRETTAALLARVLHAAGRQADALAVLDRTRRRLVEELGVDPGAELEEARLAVLRGGTVAVRRPPPFPAPALTSFVGRDNDVRRIRELLATARLVTLTGPGGAGKTRLAREAIARRGDESRVAELAALTDAHQLPGAVLAAVGEPELLVRSGEGAEPDTTRRLVAALTGRRVTLVLDNCEHLVAAVAALAESLLHACPGLRVLATSREPLGIAGEVLHLVDALAPADAVRLFAERAAAVRPGFALTADVASAVDEICRRLDGQPLPIELAAARLRTLSSAEIAARLDDRFRLLTSGSRTALPRHQTLRAVVDWSWDLLTDPERAVARRLAAFAGGATAETAERVCAGPPASGDVFELLAALVDKSIVVAVLQPGAATRYRMLETIREYAGERLDEAGERGAAEAAHLAALLELVESAEPHLRRGDQLPWLARLRAEAEEIDVALYRAVAAGDAAKAHRLVAAMAWSWIIRGLFEDAMRWLDAVHAMDGPAPPRARALNRVHQALLRAAWRDFPAARSAVDTALALCTELPRPLPPLLELAGPVDVLFADGDDRPARRLAVESSDPWVRGFALHVLAMVAENEGEVDEQRRLVRAGHEEFRVGGDRFGLGMVVHSLGELEDIAGEHEAAARAYDESIALATELGNDDDLPQFLNHRGMLAARQGDLAAARDGLRRALALSSERAPGVAGALHVSLAHVERMGGRFDRSREHLAAAAAADEAGRPHRRASLATAAAAVDVAAGDPPAARARLADGVAAAVDARDGPVVAVVAEVAATLALDEGAPEAAGLLLGVAATQRGATDLGNPEVVAAHDRVRAALGPAAADEAVRRGRELPRDAGLAALVAYVGEPVGQVRR